MLAEVAPGLSNSEIASRLFVTEQTVATHIKHIFTKIGVAIGHKLVVFAYENGLAGTRPANTSSLANRTAGFGSTS